MVQKRFTVSIPKFDEARPVAEIVQTASRYSSAVYFISGSKKINAKSIMGMMSLGLCNNEEIEVEASGDDEEAAVDAIIGYMTASV